MKNYALNQKEKKNFILDYYITRDGNIIVNFVEGDSWILPYNKSNEEKLIKKMEQQVKEAEENIGEYAKKKERYSKLFFAMLANIFVSGLFVAFSQNALVTSVFATILASSSVCGLGFAFYSGFNNILLKDIEKNKKFIEMKDKINSGIKNNQNILSNVSEKTRKIVKKIPEGEETAININSFNYIPNRDFEQIVENIDRAAMFDFDYTEHEKVSNGIARKRVRK